METKNREKMLLMAVAVCVGLWLVNYIVVSPLSRSWSARQDKIKELRTAIIDGTNLMANAKSITNQWNHMRTNTLNPNETGTQGQLFRAFQVWAQTNGVILVGQRAQRKDSDDPAYENEEWHADVTGDLTQIFHFLGSVETSPLGLKVDSVELSSRDERGLQLALGLTVSGLILNPDTNNAPPPH
jgi:hypothetical protein